LDRLNCPFPAIWNKEEIFKRQLLAASFFSKKGGCQVEGLPGIDYEKVFIYFKHTLYPLFMISVYVGEMDKQCYVNENFLNEK